MLFTWIASTESCFKDCLWPDKCSSLSSFDDSDSEPYAPRPY